MDIAEALLALSQIAVGLAGFSSILVALSGEPNRWAPIDAFRIVAMLWSSFTALFLSLAPFVLRFLGMDLESAWRWSAALLGVLALAAVGATTRGVLQLSRPDRLVLRPRLVVFVQSVVSVVGICGIGAGIGWLTPPEGMYFAGVVGFLALAAFSIVRFLFARPAA
jgi:hypothetical protein